MTVENGTTQRPDGSWAAVANSIECTHKHSTEKPAADCYEWEASSLVRTGQSAWAKDAARRQNGGKSFPTFAAPPASATAEDLVSDADAAKSHRYIPMKDLIELELAVATGAKTRPAANLMFLGPSGSGKTDGARDFATRISLPFVKVDAASMTDPEAWFGTRELVVKEGVAVTEYRPSTFVEALQQPCVLLIDEVSRVRDEHRNVLLPVLDATRAVMNPLTGDVIQRHPQCFIVMAGNVGLAFTGTNAIDPAFMTRAIVVEFDYIGEDDERRVVADASGCDADTAFVFVRFAGETRAKAKIDPEFLPISTREIIEAGRLVKDGLTRDLAIKFIVLNGASSEGGSASVRQELQNLWNGVRAVRPEKAAPATAGSTTAWVCSAHGSAKDIPAGVSSKTGKSYKAFRACPVFGCQETSDRNPGGMSTNPTTGATTANGVTICGDCNQPQPAGRSVICISCGAALQ